jgi:isocitrate dehydrogenase
MLDHVGWHEAATRIRKAVELAIAEGKVTVDLASQMSGAKQVGCREFGQILLANLERV